MPITHSLGFPRIGRKRELKFALEQYWRGEISASALQQTADTVQSDQWQQQRELNLQTVGDFALYDQVLDISAMLGNLPARSDNHASALDQYFQSARGHAGAHSDSPRIAAAEMTKWFDTNYHYLVPEFDADTQFSAQADKLIKQIKTAQAEGHSPKPVLLGPVSYLWLGKSHDQTEKLSLLDDLLAAYDAILLQLSEAGVEWVQIDEPVLVTDLDADWQRAISHSYFFLQKAPVKLLLATYFGHLKNNLQLACELPVAGLHIDAVSAQDEVIRVADWLPAHKVLSLGVIDGRNIWKSDLTALLDWLEPLHSRLQDRLWLAPSCSLLHVPLDLALETELDPEIADWLAFAVQKLAELQTLAEALEQGRDAVATTLADNHASIQRRQQSSRVHNPGVQQRRQQITASMQNRQQPYAERARLQQDKLQLPAFATTTIGSFPQTTDIRNTRRQYKNGQLGETDYQNAMQAHIRQAIDKQEKLDLDVLVHGEAERNDMVEYFGEQLDGFCFTRFGWVQSYGSRCVKPPVIFGDVSRPATMTVDWIRYAQSLTDKPVKGMLTGPVTILNWSFVRDDQPRHRTCEQIALAIREEVLDLEKAGVNIIQIDEAALREGLPLRQDEWKQYLDWAVGCFRLTANGVADTTQIHTHMCYSEFNDIIEAIAAMDADVITIETSRSHMELLDVFREFNYPNAIGPGVYDIHSPNIPAEADMVHLLHLAAERIDASQLWVNPDCGLKTRKWEEVEPALRAMVSAARQCRKQLAAA